MDWRERIHSDPEIMGGRPVVRGSRVTAEYILRLLADKPDCDAAAAEFRHVGRPDVLAAVGFAAHLLGKYPEAASRLAASAHTRAE